MQRTTRPRLLRLRSVRSLGDRRHSTRYLAGAAAVPLLLFGVQADLGPNDPWEMHTIIEGSAGTGNFAGADGVDLGDADRDGDVDIATGFEQGHRVSIALNPTITPTGPGNVEDEWPRVKLPDDGGRILGPEDVIFADVDDDDAMDIIVAAEADKLVTVFFGPEDPLDVAVIGAWDRVDIEASRGVEAAMRLKFEDMDGDGAKDILVGAREINASARLGYYSSTTPRNPTSWTHTLITPVGWVQEMLAVDMNGDDDMDVLYSDKSPIKTPNNDMDDDDPTRRGLRWLENPGDGSADWTGVHQISPVEPLHKWFTYVDWDSDGDKDLIDCRSEGVTHETAIWLNGAGDPDTWTKLAVTLPANVGLCQHATAAEIDNAGAGAGLDLAFSYSHAGQHVPPNTVSGVVWLKNTGTEASPVWVRHEISGGPGIKYDNLLWDDLDGDGDDDAITSEQHQDLDGNGADGPGLGVIWYENPTNNP
jgi:hypothetical protein